LLLLLLLLLVVVVVVLLLLLGSGCRIHHQLVQWDQLLLGHPMVGKVQQ
jgi:hypothetical protein